MLLYCQKKLKMFCTTSCNVTGIFQKILSGQHFGFKEFGSLCYSCCPTLTHKQQCATQLLPSDCEARGNARTETELTFYFDEAAAAKCGTDKKEEVTAAAPYFCTERLAPPPPP